MQVYKPNIYIVKKMGLLIAVVHGYLTVVNSYPALLISYPFMCVCWAYVAIRLKETELLLLNLVFLALWLYGLYNYYYIM